MSDGSISWAERQAEMEAWYRTFSSDVGGAARALAFEYRPFAAYIRPLAGAVLDVGGGAGLAAAFMDPSATLTVVDPSATWTTEDWRAIRLALNPASPEPTFLQGVGESLAFPDGRFDGILSMWSLNHVADPERCLAEMHRVTRPGATGLVVLEDVEPTWRDVAALAVQTVRRRPEPGSADHIHWHQDGLEGPLATARRKLAGPPWPLQPDHLRITDAAFRAWIAGRFAVLERRWIGGFLTFHLRRE